MCVWMLICKLSRKKQKREKQRWRLALGNVTAYMASDLQLQRCVSENLCVWEEFSAPCRVQMSQQEQQNWKKGTNNFCLYLHCYHTVLSPTYKHISVGSSLIAVCMDGQVHSIFCPVVLSVEM